VNLLINYYLQTHPNVDKDLFRNKYQIGLKNPQKPFPVNTDVPILKWRYQTTDEAQIPLTSKIVMTHLLCKMNLTNISPQLIAGRRRMVLGDVM